jgi:hypothetical protein
MMSRSKAKVLCYTYEALAAWLGHIVSLSKDAAGTWLRCAASPNTAAAASYSIDLCQTIPCN